MKTEFRKATFEGAVLDSTPGGPGFRCEDGTKTHVCFGRTGEQVRFDPAPPLCPHLGFPP